MYVSAENNNLRYRVKADLLVSQLPVSATLDKTASTVPARDVHFGVSELCFSLEAWLNHLCSREIS